MSAARFPWTALPGVATPTLRFNTDGSFHVLQINDTQDHHRMDRRTLETISRAVEKSRAGLIVVNGDVISGDTKNPREIEQAMNNVAAHLDSLGCPWCITFGNHDADFAGDTGFGEPEQLEFYRRYRHNINPPHDEQIPGIGTCYLPILSADGKHHVYGVWLIHSGRYAPKEIAGQDFETYPPWGWVSGRQLAWYHDTSVAIELSAGRKVPSLLFQHLPLWEHLFMWYAGVLTRTPEDEARGARKHRIVGERNEGTSCGPFNSGLFAMILDRGETRGVFCGHDHCNTYCGDYYGVLLGYSPGIGFSPYGLKDEAKNRVRGARVIRLRADAPDALPETEVIFARDLGIDLSPADQRIDPLPFPF